MSASHPVTFPAIVVAFLVAGLAGSAAAEPSADAGAVPLVAPAASTTAARRELLLSISTSTLRAHPLGERASPIVAALPFWKHAFSGSGLDPVRDTDWLSVTAESLQKPDRDLTLVRLAISETEADKALAKATKSSTRVSLRVPPHGLVILPSGDTLDRERRERLLRTGKPSFKPSELVRATLDNPGARFPALSFPKPIRTLRLTVRSAASAGGAVADLDGDCDDTAAAQAAADAINALLARNAFWGNILTDGLLRGMHAFAEGERIKMHVDATRSQVESVLDLIGPSLGAAPPPRPAAKPPSAGPSKPAAGPGGSPPNVDSK